MSKATELNLIIKENPSFTFNGFEITMQGVLNHKFTEKEKELLFKELKDIYNVSSDKDAEKAIDCIESLLPYFKQR